MIAVACGLARWGGAALASVAENESKYDATVRGLGWDFPHGVGNAWPLFSCCWALAVLSRFSSLPGSSVVGAGGQGFLVAALAVSFGPLPSEG